MKKTNLKNIGYEYPSQSDIIKEKMCETSLKNYGFRYPVQNKDFFNKNLKNGFKLTYIDELSCQGSYEVDFVLKYKDKVKIENGLSIEYYFLDEKIDNLPTAGLICVEYDTDNWNEIANATRLNNYIIRPKEL